MGLQPDPSLLAAIQEAASVAALGDVFGDVPFPGDEVAERWSTSKATIFVEREVGFVAVDPPWLEALYVMPEWWGSGVADRLHDRALEVLRRSEVADSYLWVIDANMRARHFYERRGWFADGANQVVTYPPHPRELRYRRRVGGETSSEN